MKRGEKTPESVKRRKTLQRHKQRYMELREELQLAGVIPVEPVGATRDERVDPASQEEQSLPAIVRESIRRGWNVPDDIKPQLVDELISIVQDGDASYKEKIASFSALAKADWNQWRQDNPDKGAAQVPTVLNITEIIVDVGSNQDSAAIPKAEVIQAE